MRFLAGIILVLTATVLHCTATDEDPQLIVSAPAGTFRGTTLISLQGHLFRAFGRIPYALPPLGNLRFAKPQPHPKLEGTYDATRISPLCVQAKGVNLPPGQEDCLYLNVYAPVIEEEEKASSENLELKKVFVYIHGGAFFVGSAQEYIPGDLVALGNIIVVTLNYRLAWLGFLKGDTPELPGNQGMWDQLMALNWVKDNIRSFGGDPDDITIGGESMGGESVSTFAILPHGKGLFTKGLVMSGTIFASPSKPGSSDVLLDLLTDRVGCKDDSGDTEAVVKCLRSLPAEAFVLPEEGELTNKFTSVDGDFFPAPVADLVKDQDYLTNVGFYERNYIVSLTNNEGACYFLGPFGLQKDPTELISQKFGIPGPVSKEILTWYKEHNESFFNPVYNYISDPILVMPSFQFMETFVGKDENSMSTKKGDLYFLFFNHKPTYMPAPDEGTVHAMDLTYMFDFQPKDILRTYYATEINEGFTEEDFRLKNLLITMLVDFMQSGYPGGTLRQDYNVVWPEFEEKSEHYLSFAAPPAVRDFPMKEQRQLWNKMFLKYGKDEQRNEGKDEL